MEELIRISDQANGNVHGPIYTSKEVEELGIPSTQPVPKPEKCKYCGKTLYYECVVLMGQAMIWNLEKPRCDCAKAVEFWKRWDAKQEELRKAQAIAEEQEQKRRKIEAILGKSGIKQRFLSRTFENFAVNNEKSNMEKFERNPKYIEFHATKDVRIFKFIHSIFCPNMIPVNEFTKISDIKDFLSKQWSDMFKKYLKQCKEDKEIETIKTSIAKLESIVNSMTVMLDAVGKNVLKETPNEYNVIKEKQQVTEICNMIKDAVSFEDRADKSSQSPLPNRLIDFIFDVNKYISSVLGADQDAEYARNETYGHSRFIENVRNLGMRKDLFVFFVDSEAIPNICENLNNERIKKLVAEELSNTDFSFKRKIRFRA
jgi:hypothetical protein|nr:MAG TPA: hypothetical protein [Caudoviricetes sp.]